MSTGASVRKYNAGKYPQTPTQKLLFMLSVSVDANYRSIVNVEVPVRVAKVVDFRMGRCE